MIACSETGTAQFRCLRTSKTPQFRCALLPSRASGSGQFRCSLLPSRASGSGQFRCALLPSRASGSALLPSRASGSGQFRCSSPFDKLRERVIPVSEALEDTAQLFCLCFFRNEISRRSLGDSKIPKNFGTAFSKSLIFFDFTRLGQTFVCAPLRKTENVWHLIHGCL